MAKKKQTRMLAVLGRSRRGGRWTVASRSSVLAFLGTCHLDMRRSTVDGDVFKMKVTVVFGTATFVLPQGASVEPSGVSFLAGSLIDVPRSDTPCATPTLEIESTTVLGRIRIVTGPMLEEDLSEQAPAAVAQIAGARSFETSVPVLPVDQPLPAPLEPNSRPPAGPQPAPRPHIGDSDPPATRPETDLPDQPARRSDDAEPIAAEPSPALAAVDDEPTVALAPSDEVSRHAATEAGKGAGMLGRRKDDADDPGPEPGGVAEADAVVEPANTIGQNGTTDPPDVAKQDEIADSDSKAELDKIAEQDIATDPDLETNGDPGVGLDSDAAADGLDTAEFDTESAPEPIAESDVDSDVESDSESVVEPDLAAEPSATNEVEVTADLDTKLVTEVGASPEADESVEPDTESDADDTTVDDDSSAEDAVERDRVAEPATTVEPEPAVGPGPDTDSDNTAAAPVSTEIDHVTDREPPAT